MSSIEARDNPEVREFLAAASKAAGKKLLSVVLYGSAARGDYHEKTSDWNFILVLEDLKPETLESLSPLIRPWVAKGQPTPRLFTPELIAHSADVFPIEMLDLQNSRAVLAGRDPFAGLSIGRAHLRLQCERELRTKLMRLREAYIECHDRPAELERLLTTSYTTFVALFRGCLSLMHGVIPRQNAEVVKAFCEHAELQLAPFEAVDRLKRGEKAAGPLKELFSGYYVQLTQAVEAIDRFGIGGGESR
jgi:predicted nucleotidyltransferase